MASRLWSGHFALAFLVTVVIVGHHELSASYSFGGTDEAYGVKAPHWTADLYYRTHGLARLQLDNQEASVRADIRDPGIKDDIRKVTGVAKFYPFCPKKADMKGASYKQVFMVFHRVKDDMSDELRIRENDLGWEENDIDLMVSDYDFDPKKPTLIYSPGYFEDTGDNWLRTIRANYNRLFKAHENASYNLLFYDWSTYAFGPYGVSVSTVPLVADKMAEFFEYLHDKHNFDLDKLHMISFSLSAHIFGLAARRLANTQRVGQITHLDPTGVCFHDETRFGEKYRTRPEDAVFSLARHYNMYGLGSYKTLGSLDIFINGGQTQPLVSPQVKPLTSSSSPLIGRGVLSHLRGTSHEMNPFRPESDCHEIAYECSSYENFMAGLCGTCGKDGKSCLLVSTVGNMELNRDIRSVGYRPNTRMFLNTGEDQFCAYQYQVILKLKAEPSARLKQLMSRQDFALKVAAGVMVSPKKIKGDKVYQLLTLPKRVRSFAKRVNLDMHNELKRSIEKLKIRYLSNLNADKRAEYSASYCSHEKGLIKC